VIVDGRVVVDGGQLSGVDESDLIQKAAAAHLWQKDRFVEQHPRGESVDLLFPPTYSKLRGEL